MASELVPVSAAAAAGAGAGAHAGDAISKTNLPRININARFCLGPAWISGELSPKEPPVVWYSHGLVDKNGKRFLHCMHCHDRSEFPSSQVYEARPGESLGCTRATDVGATTLIHKDLKVSLVAYPDGSRSSDEIAPLYLDSESKGKADIGVGIYNVPTQTNYGLRISMHEPEMAPQRKWDVFFIKEMKVGDERVKINNDLPTYFFPSYVLKVDGFDGHRGFEFLSPSNIEMQLGALSEAVKQGYAKRNIITITIQKYKHIPPPPPSPPPLPHDIQKIRLLMSAAILTAQSRVDRLEDLTLSDDGLERITRGFYKKQSQSGVCKKSQTWGDTLSADDAAPAPSATNEAKSHNLMFMEEAAATAGTTVESKRYIPPLATRPSTGTYEPVDDPVVMTIQLVCRQTDSEKLHYNLVAQLKEAGYHYWAQSEVDHEKEKNHLIGRLNQCHAQRQDAIRAREIIVEKNPLAKHFMASLDLSLLGHRDLETDAICQYRAEALKAKQQDALLKFSPL